MPCPLVLDEPTPVDDDELSPEDWARLEQALEGAEQEIERGDYVDGSEFLARLQARREAR